MSATCSHTLPTPNHSTTPTLTPHSLTYMYLTATTSEPHQLYPFNSPSSSTCTSAHSQTHSSLFTASPTHSSLLTASHPLTATLLIASSHSQPPSSQHPTSPPHSFSHSQSPSSQHPHSQPPLTPHSLPLHSLPPHSLPPHSLPPHSNTCLTYLCTRYTLVHGGTNAKILATRSTRTVGG